MSEPEGSLRLFLIRVALLGSLLAGGLLMGGVPASAYQGSSGASVTTCDSRVQPGGSTCVTATFTTNGRPNQGDTVTFSSDHGSQPGCTVTFKPSSSVTGQNGQASSTATFGSSCRGNVQVCATDTNTGQTACASVIVNSGNSGGGGGGNGGSGGNGGGHSAARGGTTPTAAVAGGSGAGLLVIAALSVGILRRRRRAPLPVA